MARSVRMFGCLCGVALIALAGCGGDPGTEDEEREANSAIGLGEGWQCVGDWMCKTELWCIPDKVDLVFQYGALKSATVASRRCAPAQAQYCQHDGHCQTGLSCVLFEGFAQDCRYFTELGTCYTGLADVGTCR